MKNILLLLFIATFLSSCCENKELVLDGKLRTFEYYGLFDKDEIKNDSINYEMSTGGLVCSIIFCETAIIPIYLIGWNFYEPKSVKVEYRNTKK